MKPTKEQISDAIVKNLGIKTGISKSLNCSRSALDDWIKEYKLTDLIQEQRFTIHDKVEHNLVKWINEENEKVTLWYAERQMFAKYGNRQTVESINNEPLKIVIEDPLLQNKIDKIK